MKYYNTGKKGFMKAWFKAGLNNWVYFLLTIFSFIWLLNFLGEDFTQYNVQLVAFATVFMISIFYSISKLFYSSVIDYMVDHDFMTTDKNKKNFYKNIEFNADDKMYKDDLK